MSMGDRSFEGPTVCICGNEWFHLVGDGEPAVVRIQVDGKISGYLGTFSCSECGERWVSPRSRMRLVPDLET